MNPQKLDRILLIVYLAVVAITSVTMLFCNVFWDQIGDTVSEAIGRKPGPADWRDTWALVILGYVMTAGPMIVTSIIYENAWHKRCAIDNLPKRQRTVAILNEIEKVKDALDKHNWDRENSHGLNYRRQEIMSLANDIALLKAEIEKLKPRTHPGARPNVETADVTAADFTAMTVSPDGVRGKLFVDQFVNREPYRGVFPNARKMF